MGLQLTEKCILTNNQPHSLALKAPMSDKMFFSLRSKWKMLGLR